MKLYKQICILLLCAAFLGGQAGALPSNFHKKAYDLFLEGANAYAAGKNPEAIALLEEALLLNPRLDSARGILIIALGEESLILYEDGAYDQALPYLNKLLKLFPGDAEIQEIFQQARKQMPQDKRGIQIVRSAQTLKDQYRLDWMGYVGLGRDQSRLDERVAYIENMYTAYAGTMVGTDEIEQEMKVLVSERKLLLNSYTREERLQEAFTLYGKDRILEAIEIWDSLQAVSVDPEIERYLAEARIALKAQLQSALSEAQILREERKWDKAFFLWKKALSLDPQNKAARIGIKGIHADLTRIFNNGVTAYQENNYTAAIGYWEEINTLYPGFRDISSYIEQVNTLIKKGQEKTRRSLVSTYISNGDAQHNDGDFQAAVASWKKALKLDPENTSASTRIKKLLESLYKRARKDQRAGNVNRADDIWKLIVSIDPNYRRVKTQLTQTVTTPAVDVTALVNEGEKAFLAGDYQGALVSLRKAVKLNSMNKKAVRLAVEAALAQGIMYYRGDNLKDAISLWDFVLKYNPGHQKASKYRKRAQLKLDMLEKLK